MSKTSTADQVLVGDGVLATPSIAASAHPDTGIAWNIGAGGDLDFVVDGALNQRLKVDHTNFLVPHVPLSGTPAAPGFCFGNSFTSGVHSSGSNNFGTASNGIKAGWRVTNIGGGKAAVHFQDHQPSGTMCVSLSGGYDTSAFDFDTGISFHVGGTNNEVSVFSNGVERTKYTAAGAIVEAPELANSTGSVTDTGAVQTSDATANVTLWTIAALADNTTYVVTATVVGRDTAGTERCSYTRIVQAHRQGGAGAAISSVTAVHSVESDAGLDATFTVSGNALRLSVTGKAGTTMNWSASVHYIASE